MIGALDHPAHDSVTPHEMPPHRCVMRLVVLPFSAKSVLNCTLSVVQLALIGGAVCDGDLRAAEPEGRQIYLRQCASCHGNDGQGTAEHYPQPLEGDRSLADLAEFISESMPEEQPEQCTGADARRVAAYIFDAFYSEMAQLRHARPSIDPSRLTVRQYAHCVADLVGSFLPSGSWDAERGLVGEYFHSRHFNADKRVLKRRDPTIDFDFGTARPGPESAAEQPQEDSSPDASEEEDDDDASAEFSVRWRGGLLAPDTGQYEFILQTENGARLWVNDMRQPLIDAWVRSGDMTEYRGSVRLLGGRVYPFRCECFRFQEDSASIRLRWKRPRAAEEVVPERVFSPHRFPPVLVITTPFPPDDSSTGYARGTRVSRQWDAATTYAALEASDYVVAHLNRLAGTGHDARDREARLKQFCEAFAERAFRRPLTAAQRAFYIDRHLESSKDIEQGIRRVVLVALKSPRFLYREATDTTFDAHDTASWLALAMWDSLPDRALLDAAAAGRLESSAQIVAHVERMGSDLRTRAKLRAFFMHWLRVDHYQEITKDSSLFPKFDDRIVSDLRTSLDLFLDEMALGPDCDFRELLLSNTMYVNGRLAEFYGVALPSDAPFQKVTMPQRRRVGLLSHPFVMAGLAYSRTSSPIHRGVFIARNLLGRRLDPPPDAVAPLSPDLHPELTTRQRVAMQTRPAACQSCHAVINPLGFSLENFDAVGRYREQEKGQPIDSRGSYTTRRGDEVTFAGARDLGEFLARSEEVQTAFVRQLFEHMIKQPIKAYQKNLDRDLCAYFRQNDYNIQALLQQMVAVAAVHHRRLSGAAAGTETAAAAGVPQSP